MPVLQKGVAALANQMPKVIPPKAHAIADYATIGTFGLLAGLFWGRSKRAAIAAIVCAGAELTNTLLTDFQGGVTDAISYPTHLKIDMGLAAAATTMPNLMGFSDEPEAKWFRILGLNMTTVTAMSDTGEPQRVQRRRRAA
ncbi:MAG: hypothetical protein ACR2IF_18645 [Terriglobales bacterium]